MSETTKLVNGLKAELKAKGLTYKDLADKLQISEPSVKRLFADESFSLERFAKACEAIGTSIAEILRNLQQNEDREAADLTPEQEELLAADSTLFLAFHRLLNGSSVEQTSEQLKIDSAQMTRLLVALDKMGVIELHPNNSIRFKTPRLIKWDNAGPLMAAYGTRIQGLYFKEGFHGPHSHNRFLSGPLSEAIVISVADRLQKLTREIEDMWEWDLRSKNEQKRVKYGVLLSCKPWQW